MYLSITGITPDNKLSKYQPFALEVDAVAHAHKYNGFSIVDPGGNQKFWIIDKVAKTITQDTANENSVMAKRNALNEIHRLEGTITPRRLRDSVLTDEGKAWVTDVEANIATERKKL